ncbi:hypothetical protein [Streptomyces sp. NPDC058268]|uniref:hypothetical protein n=1 Tax=Streptomyces sp. NPDC058268 TaxID=3346413 RepID=UPI0036E7A963
MQHSMGSGIIPNAPNTRPFLFTVDGNAGFEQFRTWVGASQDLGVDFAVTLPTPVSAALAKAIQAVIDSPGIRVPNLANPHVVEAVGHRGLATFRITMEIAGGTR